MEIHAWNLQHTYKQKDDYDGNFCSDYCIGCGACDHFPYMYAVMGFEQTVREVNYYCKQCYNTVKTGFWLVFNIKKNKEEHPTNIVIDNKDKICKDCHKLIEENDIEFNNTYFTRVVCQNCAEKYNLTVKSYYRCVHDGTKDVQKNSFFCESCEKEYSIICDLGSINCEDISKIDEYRSSQLFVNLQTGEVTEREVVDKVK